MCNSQIGVRQSKAEPKFRELERDRGLAAADPSPPTDGVSLRDARKVFSLVEGEEIAITLLLECSWDAPS
jgi:hypothetical protein